MNAHKLRGLRPNRRPSVAIALRWSRAPVVLVVGVEIVGAIWLTIALWLSMVWDCNAVVPVPSLLLMCVVGVVTVSLVVVVVFIGLWLCRGVVVCGGRMLVVVRCGRSSIFCT